MKAYIALGKIGDIINILPILSADNRNGAKPVLIVAREYFSLVQNLTYLTPVLYDGHWQDLKGAIRFAKERYSEVVVLSVHGLDFPFEKKTRSFLMEPWERAGRLQDFDTLPLKIDGRSWKREDALRKKHHPKVPYIIYADHGESAPFPHKEELAKLLAEHSDGCKILRMSEVNAEHFFDLLGLYENAMAIVSVETAHLHLSGATTLPVLAFTKDDPTRWYGTPHLKRFELLCRYQDFHRRKHEIVSVLKNWRGHRKLSAPIRTHQAFGYNPTVMNGFSGMIYRYHPTKSWKTQLVLQLGNQELPIRFPEQFDGMSMEDARLFRFNGSIYVSFVAARFEVGHTNAVTGYGELVMDRTFACVQQVHVPEFGLNNWGGIEKNWLFFEHAGKLMSIYECDTQQTVVEVEGKRVRAIHRSEPLPWAWGKIRGGCLIPYKGQYLRFFHSHTTEGHRERWVYNIGAAILENKPPFKMVAISSKPVVCGDEKLNLFCRHWKQNVVFPAGVIPEQDRFTLFYGYNDCECRKIQLTEADLNL